MKIYEFVKLEKTVSNAVVESCNYNWVVIHVPRVINGIKL